MAKTVMRFYCVVLCFILLHVCNAMPGLSSNHIGQSTRSHQPHQPQPHQHTVRVVHEQASYSPIASPYYEHDSPTAVDPPSFAVEALHPMEDDMECDKEPKGDCFDYLDTRSYSGCNNLNNPSFGSNGAPMNRILPAQYDDAFFKRFSQYNQLLPNPRVLSLMLRELPEKQHTDHNVMVMQLGQFIDHDLVITKNAMPADMEKHQKDEMRNKCKDCESWINEPICVPIPIPGNDPKLGHLGRQCLPFMRSVALSSDHGKVSLEQINLNTAFLDLSAVYGSTKCLSNLLRLHGRGCLQEVGLDDGVHSGLPPLFPMERFEDCRTPSGTCFMTGDERGNENVGLLTIHAIFLRKHNSIARGLAKINNDWTDTEIFEVARKINIAIFQHIVMNEFVPQLIGLHAARHYGITSSPTGFYNGYDESVNPGVLNEFATAAYRLGHTLIPDEFRFVDKYYRPLHSVPLVNTFFNVTEQMFPMTKTDDFVRGLMAQRLMPFDMKLVDDMLDRLFEQIGKPNTAEDLFARNIARGREHGLPGYVHYRSQCGLGYANDFDDLRPTVGRAEINVLRRAYSHVNDIDLYVGGLAEDPLPGALVGPTFSCIVALQFLNIKRGDRFWYENPENGFSLQQLNEIKSYAKLSNLVCETFAVDKENYVPTEAMKLPCRATNPLKSCQSSPGLNINLWVDHTHRPKRCWYEGAWYNPRDAVHASPCLSCTCGSDGNMLCQPNRRGCTSAGLDEYCKLECDIPPEEPYYESYNSISFSGRSLLDGQESTKLDL